MRNGKNVFIVKNVIVDLDIFRIHDDVVWRNLDGESVLLNLESNFYYSLNDTGTFIYEQIKEGQSVHQILEHFYNTYRDQAEPETMKKDIFEVLEDLLKEGLIERIVSAKKASKN